MCIGSGHKIIAILSMKSVIKCSYSFFNLNLLLNCKKNSIHKLNFMSQEILFNKNNVEKNAERGFSLIRSRFFTQLRERAAK